MGMVLAFWSAARVEPRIGLIKQSWQNINHLTNRIEPEHIRVDEVDNDMRVDEKMRVDGNMRMTSK